MEIIITTTDNRRFTLKPVEELANIRPNRFAAFVFTTGQIFYGCSNGEVDEDGYFPIRHPDRAQVGVAFPVKMLLGWAYIRKKKGNQT